MKSLALAFIVVLVTSGIQHLLAVKVKDREQQVQDDVNVAATSILEIDQYDRCPDATCQEPEVRICFNFCENESISYRYEVGSDVYNVKCCMNNCGQCTKKWVYTDKQDKEQYVTDESELTAVLKK